MTRGQRSGHLIMWLILAPLAIAVVVTALALRPAAPVEPALPSKITSGGAKR
ncbi:MAG: hypothetical protein SGJ09_01755 [Phycisphaerae bacterium]|nr:hypothetical protein [Phycisphaerae bacterium]